jgi:hypothetical protein
VEQNWDSVLYFGNLALNENVDYNYLRLRMGDASLENGKYVMAMNHFNKAIGFSEHNDYAKSQKYLALQMMGKPDRANKMYKSFSPQLKNKVRKLPTIEFVNLDVGNLFSPNINNNDSIHIMGDDSIFGTQYLMGNQQFIQLGIKAVFAKNFSLYLGVNSIKINTRKDFQYANYAGTITVKTDYGYDRYIDTIPEYLNYSHKGQIIQNEIYLNTKLQLENDFAISAFANLILVNTEISSFNYSALTITDTSFLVEKTGDFELFEYQQSNYEFFAYDTTIVNFVAGINFEKDIDIASFDAFFTYSDFKGHHQYQFGAAAIYYPLGNLNLYGKTAITYFTQSSGSRNYSDENQKLIFQQSIGVKLVKRLWANASLTYGNLTNSNINGGMVVYNLTDQINHKIESGLSIFVSNNLELNISYQFFDKTRYYYNYQPETELYSKTPVNYITNSIIGGLKWKF